MKSLMIASIAILLASASQAQGEYAALNKSNQQTNISTTPNKKEKREERKELRKEEGPQVTYQSKQHFYADFGPVSNAEWKRSKYFDEVTFQQDGKTMTAYYDIESELVGTTETKSFADLPADAQKYINSKYKDYSVDKVVLFDDNEYNESDMLLYGHQFEDADNYFVELQKDNKAIILQVNMAGEVSFFTTMQ